MNLHAVDRTALGLWVYILSDCVLFAALFASYAVLHGETAGGPSAIDLFDRSFVLIETLVLLASSFTCGLALIAARRGTQWGVWVALIATLALGLAFLGMEVSEFSHLIADGHGWQTSAFLSAFFTLVGTHGLHVLVGSLWLLVLLGYVMLRGLDSTLERRLSHFSLFWHFLDIVWICVFSLVYLLGTLP